MTDLNYVIYDELGGIDAQAFRRVKARENHLNYILSPVFVDIKDYYLYKHSHDVRMAKLKHSRWPMMTKKQAAMFVEAGIVKKEDVINWEDIKKYTKDISKEIK